MSHGKDAARDLVHGRRGGHWLPDDSTLVAEYFYRKLPALLEKTGAGENDNGEGS